MAYSPYSELILKMQKEIDGKDEEIKTLRQAMSGEERGIFSSQEDMILDLKSQLAKLKIKTREKDDTIKVLEKENIDLRCEMVGLNAAVRREKEKPPLITYIPIERQKIKKKTTAKSEFEKEYNTTRSKILERDNYKCVECGGNKYLHVHHKVHRKNGGTNDPNNLITLCKWCHAERHKGEPVYNIMRKALFQCE